MTSMTNTSKPEPKGSDRRLRAKMYKALKNAVIAAWRECVEECAEDYTTHPPIYDGEGDTPDFVDHGWYYDLSGLDDYAYDYIHPLAWSTADELFRRYRLANRPNADVWRKWLGAKVQALVERYASGVAHDVAERMAEKFEEEYGVEFSYYLSDGRAIFVLTDGEELGDEWEVLDDVHVRGRYRGDTDYLRVVYAYNAPKQLLLRIHHEYVGIPSGGWALEWVLSEEWWDTTPEEAREIVSEAVGDEDEEGDCEDEE